MSTRASNPAIALGCTASTCEWDSPPPLSDADFAGYVAIVGAASTGPRRDTPSDCSVRFREGMPITPSLVDAARERAFRSLAHRGTTVRSTTAVRDSGVRLGEDVDYPSTEKRDRNVTSGRLGAANRGCLRANADSRKCASR